MASLIETQPRDLPLRVTTKTCTGRTYIVTGANTGLGYEAAKHLATLGAAKVILGVRNVSAGEKAKAEMEAETGKTNVVEVWELDLASYKSVKAFADKAATKLDRIDALIENAAIAVGQRQLAEGHAVAVTVNVLSTLLLAVLLLPKMSESAKKFDTVPHLVIVSSSVSFDSKDDWSKIKDDPLKKMADEEMVPMKTYGLSKLLEIFAVRHLSGLVPFSRSGVVMNLVCPGLCKTELARNAPPAMREDLAKKHEQFGRTAEDGSRTLLHGAVAGKESHGSFLSNCEIADGKLPSWIADKESEAYVWGLIRDELEAIEPGCVKAIEGK